jgi:hypothetical protein
LRTIGQAILAYSVHNRGFAPPKGSTPEYPYTWNKNSLYTPLTRYGLTLSVMSCPSMWLFNPPFDRWLGHMDVGNDWLVNYQYLVGLGEPKGSFAGKWYEKPPSVASYKLSRGPVKIMIVDMNLFFAVPDNGFWDDKHGSAPSVRWFYSNHAIYNKINPDKVDLRKYVKGSNRLYTDGHVKFVLPDEMGRGDQMISIKTDSARYSHAGDIRLYYW